MRTNKSPYGISLQIKNDFAQLIIKILQLYHMYACSPCMHDHGPVQGTLFTTSSTKCLLIGDDIRMRVSSQRMPKGISRSRIVALLRNVNTPFIGIGQNQYQAALERQNVGIGVFPADKKYQQQQCTFTAGALDTTVTILHGVLSRCCRDIRPINRT